MRRCKKITKEVNEYVCDFCNETIEHFTTWSTCGVCRAHFCLDCGHHVTFGENLGNHITILNGKEPIIICSQCGY